MGNIIYTILKNHIKVKVIILVILPFKDESLISPELSRIFERVRQSADFMPVRQMEKVMSGEFGHDWREKHFKEFTDQVSRFIDLA